MGDGGELAFKTPDTQAPARKDDLSWFESHRIFYPNCKVFNIDASTVKDISVNNKD